MSWTAANHGGAVIALSSVSTIAESDTRNRVFNQLVTEISLEQLLFD